MVCACIPLILLVLYIFFDVNYFLRVIFEIGLGRIFKKKKNPLETTEIYGFCTTQDLDVFFSHMNNARFVRELDFARFDFYVRTGIYSEMKKVDGHALQGACSIRYRRPIQKFSFYKIQTRLIYWEEKALYFEHSFVSFDNFVRAVVLIKQNTLNFDPRDLLKKITKDQYQEPKMPLELRQWNESVETLSAKFRKSD